MSFASRQHTAAAAGSFSTLGTMNLFADSFDNIGTTDTGSISFNTDGTISTTTTDFEERTIDMPTNWYGPTTGGIGNSFQVRFTLQSGTAWDSGLVSGTLYALSSARALAWSVTYPGQLVASVLVELYYTAGTTPYKSGTLSVDLYNDEA